MLQTYSKMQFAEVHVAPTKIPLMVDKLEPKRQLPLVNTEKRKINMFCYFSMLANAVQRFYL